MIGEDLHNFADVEAGDGVGDVLSSDATKAGDKGDGRGIEVVEVESSGGRERLGSLVTTKAAAMGVIREAGALQDDAIRDLKAIRKKLCSRFEKSGETDNGDSIANSEDLLQLVSSSLLSSIVVYGLSDIRKLTRKKEIIIDELFTLPLERSEVVRLCRMHAEEYRKLPHFGEHFYIAALEALVSDGATKDVLNARASILRSMKVELDSCSVVAFDDENAEKEAVFLIEVDTR
jgi:hypothetical protein